MHQSNQTHSHGSTVYQGESTLDQERAASMADEGGVSGAVTDAREQAQGPVVPLVRRRRLGDGQRWALAALGGLGVFLLLRQRGR